MKGLQYRPKWYRDFVLRRLPRGSSGAEIGVWKAEFSERILRIVRPAHLHLVDPWRLAAENQSAWWGANSGLDPNGMEAIFLDVQRRMASNIASGQVVLHRATSVEAALSILDGSLDWVYLDGDHLYDPVLKDLESWWPKIRPGGWILGDDYDMPQSRWKDGVTLAAKKFSADLGLQVDYPGRHQFVLQKPEAPPAR